MKPGMARKTTAAGTKATRASGTMSPAPGSNAVAPLRQDLKTLDAPAATLTVPDGQTP